MFSKVRRVLFVGSHSDDEIVCAGTLFKLSKQADVHVLTFSYARPEGGENRPLVHSEWEASMHLLNATARIYDFGCDTLPAFSTEIRQKVYDYVRGFDFDAAFILPSDEDHQSHSAVGKECERAMKNRVPIIIRCHFPWVYRASSSNLYVPLTDDEMAVKLACISAYKSQAFRYDYLKMFEFYAIADGLSIKKPPTERFEVLRCVI